MKDLENIYQDILFESSTPRGFEKEKSVDDQVHPKDSGPEHVEGVEDPIEAEDKTSKNKKSLKESPQAENVQKTENSTDSGINTNMSDKNIFDKLYSTIMEADDELGDMLDMGLDDGGDEQIGDEGGDVTITLTQDQVDVLKDVLAQLEGGDEEGDEIEDLDGDGGFEEENPFPEAVEAEHTNDGAQPGHDPSGLSSGKNVVAGTASKVTSGGASGDAAGQEDGGKPKPLADTTGKMTSASNQKVDGAVKGGNQELLA